MSYIAYTLPSKARQQLKEVFPPKFTEWIGHHIAYKFGVSSKDSLPKGQATIRVIGYAVNHGLEALVVTVNGKTHRPDGKRYHITWSLDRRAGFKPVDSNNLIAGDRFASVHPIEFYAHAEML